LSEQVLGALGERDERLKALARKDAEKLPEEQIAALRAVLLNAAESDSRRGAAAEALAASPMPQAELALLEFLPDLRTPAWLRAVVTFQWGRRAKNLYLGKAILRLKYEPDDEAVIWLADALFHHGSRAGLDGLEVLMRRARTEELRALAAERWQAIGSQTDSSTTAADGSPTNERIAEAWWWIGKLSDWDLRQVDDARFVLQRLPDWVVPLLCECLHDSNVYTRVHAAQTLARMGTRAKPAGQALIAALSERQLAPTAAEALAMLGDDSVRPELERCLNAGRDLDLAVAAAMALGQLGDASALQALKAVTAPPDLVFAAQLARARLGDGRAVAPALLQALEGHGHDPEAAAAALGAWLSQGARKEPWQALLHDSARGIESAEQAAARRAAQARLVREELGL
jgi:HEAT repeat protein